MMMMMMMVVVVVVVMMICRHRAKILHHIRYFQAPEGRRPGILLHNLKEKESGFYNVP
jgi:hypothetical protein